MLNKLKALFAVLEKGKSVADPETWKNRQHAATAVAALLMALTGAAKAIGYDLGVSDPQTEAAVIGAFSAVGYVLTIIGGLATSKKVGIGGKPTKD